MITLRAAMRQLSAAAKHGAAIADDVYLSSSRRRRFAAADGRSWPPISPADAHEIRRLR